MDVRVKKWSRWSNNEILRLRKLYPYVRLKNLAEEFPGRSRNCIVVKTLELGIPSAKIWQPEEDKILRDNFVDSPRAFLQKLLFKRSWAAI